MKPSERYHRDAVLMLAFRDAYIDLVNSARPAEDSYVLPELVPAVDIHTWQAKRHAVAAAAGPAGVLHGKYGGTYTLRNAAYTTSNVNPVHNWEISLRDPSQLRPDAVVASVDSAIARARQLAFDASERERGLTGVIAGFLRWPSNLREAVSPGRRAQRTAAGAIGVLGQVFVGALTAALTAGLVAGAIALWRVAF